jgi:tellurite resistance protein
VTDTNVTDMAANLDAEWILRTMVAMAAADGVPDEREIGLIQQIYQDQAGRPVSAEEIQRMAQDAMVSKDFLSELAAVSKALSTESKEEIIRAAYLVLLADGVVAGEERKKLQDISLALSIPEIHFGAILEDLAIWMTSAHK